MKKIINPWKDVEGYNCFGCAPENPAGVKMEFYEDGDEVVCKWKPRPEYQGWLDTLHGGIQAVLLDEICAWVVLRKLQTTGVTSKMETRYMKSVSTTDEYIELRASIQEIKRNIILIEARLYNQQGELCTKAVCTYFTFPQEKAKSEMNFLSCDLEE
ncbi:PaaI family thioesterase [Bacteroides sp. OttesenSCG-928-M17]|nr:PaaI family thioesterase [Bacteroides sp. OttesenSCG-928-M17]